MRETAAIPAELLNARLCSRRNSASSKRPPNTRLVFRFLLIATMIVGAIVCTAEAKAQTAPAVAPRIVADIEETSLTKLTGNTHPLARPEFDQGVVADSLPLRRMLLLLNRSPSQDAALRVLLDEQQSRSSTNYHRWISSQEFGQQFGPADTDVQTVSDWLQSHGFQIGRVAAGKTVIEFSGTAGQVREAFHTEIHKYVVNGEEHFANSSDPQIPTALTPVVVGTVSLHNFPRKPQSRVAGVFSQDKSTGMVKRLAAPEQLRSGNVPSTEFTVSSSGCPLNNTCYAVGPADFARIYNLPSGLDGTGQTIAIVGNSQICITSSSYWGQLYLGPTGIRVLCNTDDVASFRNFFGLPPNSPNIILDGADPGFTATETEGDLDVEWAGAIAKNATIDFVIAQDTETSSGVDLAAEYVVDNNLVPILSESFGECERSLGNFNQFYASLWEQAAAEGITVVVAAGDSGSAGCDDSAISPSSAALGPAVNGIASTPFDVAVGGTDFDITAANYAATYWNNFYDGTTKQSAKSYIPETTWNDSCAQNFTGFVAACNAPLLSGLNISAGGGGESSCAIQNGTSCQGGYAKPSWQSGQYVRGTPSTDGVRDLPDISFLAADGSVSGSFYVICEADLHPGDPACNLFNGSNFTTVDGVGGTSASASSFAAVMALVNQQESRQNGPTRQGNANYVLYALANAQLKANLNCESSTGPAAGCTFNDVTRGSNSVPCYSGTPNCNASGTAPYGLLETLDSSGNLTGIAYNSGTGYDLTTGLGTINVANLVNNWSSVVGTFNPTTTTLNMCAVVPPATSCTPVAGSITITHGQQLQIKATVSATSGTPTGDIAIIGTGTQGGLGFFALSGGSVSAQLSSLPGGTYTVTARYTGDGIFGASDSSVIAVSVTSETSTTALTAPVLNFAKGNIAETLVTPNGGTVDFGDAVYLRANVLGISGQGKATGSITFKDTTTAGTITLGTVIINADGYAELQTAETTLGSPITPVTVGTHSITAVYSGDASYVGSTSAVLPITVQAAPTTISVQVSTSFITPSNSITVSPNTSVTVTVFIDTQNLNNPSGGSLGSTFQRGADIEGTVALTIGNKTQSLFAQLSTAKADSNGFIGSSLFTYYTPTTAQNVSVTATFTPSDGNYLTSMTTSAVNINVADNEGFTINPAGMNIDCSQGFGGPCLYIPAAGQSATSPIMVSSIGLTGTVALSCMVTPMNPADLQIPSCSFTLNGAANATVSLTGNGSSGQRILTITTTAASKLPVATIHPQAPPWMLESAAVDFAACFLLLLNARTTRLRRAMVFVVLLTFIVAGAAGCSGGGSGANTGGAGNPVGGGSSGGSSSGGSSGGGSSGGVTSPGTTADIYSVVVTATPSIGTPIQTQFVVFVQ